ncbi:MAG: Hpt domain-containing protein [Aphanocapsa lilacina HA4352-LM1]|jgi:HPt (histidine-containing phosphotransfer) domain-containing protein|nr:Hpt domain-containing protein [Aphanocapsa lilacina HA4352-LM1]
MHKMMSFQPPEKLTGVVELEHLQKLCEDDPAFELELLQTFIRDAEERLQQACLAVARGDCLALQQQAHQLSGASASVGAPAILFLARRLESGCCSGGFAEAPELCRRIGEHLEAVRAFAAQRRCSLQAG